MYVLPEVRRQAGCKDPTRLYTTNNSESMNHIIKREVEWKERQLPDLIESLNPLSAALRESIIASRDVCHED